MFHTKSVEKIKILLYVQYLFSKIVLFKTECE